ncbi:ATP-binding cassette domain-containing protein, partial [Actinoalloteichus spitiensis]|uniref:ATP-binding cassette domain-containing protein n=1 Tax=Actinoalloteichus spitiensis TaxID=252394 RepID=UPI0003761FC5
AVRRSIGLTGQYATLDDLLSGRENLVMMGRLRHLDRRAARRDAQNLLDRFDLAHAADRPVRTYSGGMRRRLDLAASLLGGPPVLFLDEPTTGLDPRSRAGLWDTVRELLGTGVTILLTTQYLEEADQLADRIALINGGRITAEGTSDQLKRRVGTARLDLSFATEAERRQAAHLLLPSEARHGAGDTRLSVPVDGVDELGHLIGRLGHAGVRVADFEVSKPTLDDVFLSMTEDSTATGPAPVEARR